MPSPSEQVFETPELVEMILCQIGPYGRSDAALLKRKERLDSARLISGAFQQAIESSIHLKRARFLAHANTLQLTPTGFPVINPLLERLMRKMGAEIWRYNYDSKKPGHLTLRIMRTWSYANEDGYEELEHSDDDSWRQFKVTASKMNITMTLKQGNDDRVAYANETSNDLSNEPGDFGALFDLLTHACGGCFFEDDEGECPLQSAFPWHFDSKEYENGWPRALQGEATS